MANLDAFVPSGNWKLHGAMCQQLWVPLQKLLQVFPQVEAAHPGSRLGLQALSMVNVTISKSKNLLRQCEESSKLYLAIIGNSLLKKFEKKKSNLVENIKTLEGLVVRELRLKLVEIRRELRDAVFSVEESDIAIGEQLRKLIVKKDPDAPSSSSSGGTSDEAELEAFKDVAAKLGINSYRTAHVELRSLQRLLEKTHREDDKLNEKVVAYLMKLMQSYSERFGTEEDVPDDSSSSVPRSDDANASQMKGESEIERVAAFDNQVPDVEEGHNSGRVPAPPEDFKCPISSQLMFDPVIVASGQTFERVSIQKWIDAGHSTCPKTREHLSHNFLTPNSSVKRLIENWCRQNGVPVPSNPPDSPDISPFERALSDSGASVPFTEHDQVKVAAKEEVNHKYKRWMDTLNLNENKRWEERKEAVLEIRYYLKDDAKARVDMGNAGFMDALVRFLQDAISKEDSNSQEVGALAIYNLAVDNNRNQELLINAGIIPILDTMIDSTRQLAVEAAIALYQNISCLNKAKPLLAKTRVTGFIVNSIRSKSTLSNPCLMDVLCVLFNLATHAANVPRLIDSGIIPNLRALLAESKEWANKALLILAHIAQEPSGNDAIREAPGLLRLVVSYLESEKESEQDQSVACLLALCVKDERCVPMILQEGVIPSLVMLAGMGRGRTKEKANRLLQIFRSQRTPEDERNVIQLEDLKNNALKQVERMEAEAVAMQQQYELKRSASASASVSASVSADGGSGKTGEEDTRGSLKELSKSASRRLGKKVASLLNPKHFSRRNK